MYKNLSRLNILTSEKLQCPIDSENSLRTLIHSQTLPHLKECLKTKDILASLSKNNILKKTQLSKNAEGPKKEIKVSEIQTLYKLNQNLNKTGVDITESFIKKLKKRISTLSSLIDTENTNIILETCDEWLKLLFDNEKKIMAPKTKKLNENLSLENKQILKPALSMLALSIILIFDYYSEFNEKRDNSNFLLNINEIKRLIDKHTKLAEVIYHYNNLPDNNLLRINCKELSDLENKIINDYYSNTLKSPKSLELLEIFKQIRTISITEIYKFYKIKIKNEQLYSTPEKETINESSEEDLEDKATSATLTNPNQSNYLIPFPSTMPYTLVLDLDETLVNVNVTNNLISLRPGLKNFLNDLQPYYELVIFTTSIQSYADEVINFIEKDKKYFSYKLYRQHSHLVNNKYIKNLSLIGRDLAKTIIVDDKQVSFEMQKENGILIKPYYNSGFGRDNDFILYDLSRILIRVAEEKCGDVRECLKKYRCEIESKISY